MHHHERFVCEECGTVICQCRCDAPKISFRKGLCNKCEKQIWCEHITQKYSKSAQKNRWFFDSGLGKHASYIADKWNICPLCEAKKPE